MLDHAHEELTDKNRLLLGAGFVFGVAFTMLVLAIVAATVVGAGPLFGSGLAVTTAAGILFAGIVGVSLYGLAFPENRLDLPVETVFETDQSQDETVTERL
jgi:hypothetical protein